MQITSGKFRGRLLITPDTPATHPMGSRERLALFNSLGDISGLKVLDCFAGTGALGLEALSRGAASATFVENQEKPLAAIRQNIRALRVEDSTSVFRSDVLKFVSGYKFDLIFVDPPYKEFDTRTFRHLTDLLTPSGRLVLSHPSAVNPATVFDPNKLRFISTKKYASANISFYQK